MQLGTFGFGLGLCGCSYFTITVTVSAVVTDLVTVIVSGPIAVVQL